MSIRLSSQTLDSLPTAVAVPKYRRDRLSAGILHFGVGNFHRAHQAVYLDDLFNLGRGHDWALVGAGVLPSDETMRQKLAGQDFLTTVVEQDSDHMKARVTGPMIDYVKAGDAAAIIARLADPAIRIVSLTITEGGYYLDSATGRFNAAHPDIVRDGKDIANLETASGPKTVFGLILAGLMRRREDGTPPFTVMSCDNIPGNGHVTSDAVCGLASLADAGLADWVRRNVAFPNSMVDRITPATSARERQFLANEFGVEDNWPVFCEPFRQWVLEDRFMCGRPALEDVGVTFVKDVAPYELMKLRVLNGGHAAIAYPAALMDIHFVHEAMEVPLIRDFLARLEHDEIIPIVPPVPDTDIDAYFRLIERRFSNPRIGDTIPRLCQDGSNRQPKFIIPSIADRLKTGAPVTGLALVSALWCRFCAGTTDSGRPVDYADVAAERLKKVALAARETPAAFLAMDDIYGEVGRSTAFADAFGRWLGLLWSEGTAAALKTYLAGWARS